MRLVFTLPSYITLNLLIKKISRDDGKKKGFKKIRRKHPTRHKAKSKYDWCTITQMYLLVSSKHVLICIFAVSSSMWRWYGDWADDEIGLVLNNNIKSDGKEYRVEKYVLEVVRWSCLLLIACDMKLDRWVYNLSCLFVIEEVEGGFIRQLKYNNNQKAKQKYFYCFISLLIFVITSFFLYS